MYGTDYVMCLKQNTNGTIYAGYTSNNIHKSVDNGDTWTSTALVAPSFTVNDLEFDSNGNIYIGIFLGGITKYDISETFISLLGNSSNGLMNTRINDITVDDSGTDVVIFASCVGSSNTQGYFYRYGYTSNGGNTSVDDFANNTAFSVYPNPANQLITVQLDEHILDNGSATVALFNILGSKVFQQNVSNVSTSINIQDILKEYIF